MAATRQEVVRTGAACRLRFDLTSDRLTHYLFKYPAKFHPPVVRALLQEHTTARDLVMDPFCGSGTLLVEAAALGRDSIGTDVDPLAVFVSRVKTTRLSIGRLRRDADHLLERVRSRARSDTEYERRQFDDISLSTYRRNIREEPLAIPSIPNLFHWFRKYVVIDLARIRRVIMTGRIPKTHRDFFLLCFAAIIRRSSNADPVPVSGLEVTSYMRSRDRDGRTVNPFQLFEQAVKRSVEAIAAYVAATKDGGGARAFVADATRLASHIRSPVDAIITSPPYHNAVDYYRRHTLEMCCSLLRGSRERMSA